MEINSENVITIHNIENRQIIINRKLKTKIKDIHWNYELDSIFMFDETNQLKEFNQVKNISNPNFDMKLKLNMYVACVSCYDCHSKNSAL